MTRAELSRLRKGQQVQGPQAANLGRTLPYSPERLPRPTRAGVGFLVALLVGLVGCVNFDLSLGYALIFLMAGVWVTAAALTARMAREVSLTLLPPPHATAGGIAEYRVRVQREGHSFPVRAEITAPQAALALTVPASTQAGANTQAQNPMPILRLSTPARGPHHTGAVAALFGPLGLWQVQRALQPTRALLVWPRAEANVPAPPQGAYTQGEEGAQRVRGDADFAGLRAYVAGDSPRRVAWRRSAGREHLPGGGLLVRESDAPATLASALRWSDTAGDTETRVSRLTAWVEDLGERGLPFSLSLPDAELPLAAGEAQRTAALDALARVQPLPTPEALPQSKVNFWDSDISVPAWAWTMGALVFVLLPTLTRTPVWATLLTAALLAYGYLKHARGLAFTLSPVMLSGVAALGLVGLYLVHGTLVGLEAGSNVLTLLLALKVAESKSHRDGVLLILLAFFVTLTHFLHDMGPLSALHALASAVVLLGGLHLWSLPSPARATRVANEIAGHPATLAEGMEGRRQRVESVVEHEGTLGWKSILKVGGQMALLSLPLMLALFFFFPRPAEPLWQMQQRGGAQTGLGTSVRAGDISGLAQDNSLAFRASFARSAPEQATLYWRGPTYEAFDGLEWGMIRGDEARPPTVQPTGPAVSYTVRQEPETAPWVLALDTVQTAPRGSVLLTSMSLFQTRGGSKFELTSAPSVVGMDEMPERLEFNLRYPVGANPQAEALAKSWQRLPPAERVQEALNLFGNGSYSYTLSPPLLPEQGRVDAFLFSAQAGFCEHYASAFGYLMRAAGVPTRLVGGYQGGEVTALGGGGEVVTVRQSFAHAWNEVWLEGRGWVRVDPTGVVAPTRLSDSPEAALNGGAGGSNGERGGLSLWSRVQTGYNNLQIQWYDMVVGFDEGQQESALSRFGLGEVGGSRYWIGFGLLAALGLLPILWAWLRQSREADPALRAAADLARRLGLPRGVGEPVGSYVVRAAREYPELSPTLRDFADTFNQLRYGAEVERGALLARLRELVRGVRR